MFFILLFLHRIQYDPIINLLYEYVVATTDYVYGVYVLWDTDRGNISFLFLYRYVCN